MDGISAAPTILGILGAGAKLSIALFEVAERLGSAGKELKTVGVEISLFCSVVNQLERTLQKLHRKRYSLTAIDTTDQVLRRCKEIFDDLNSQLNHLRQYTDWAVRLKWIAGKKSKFQVQRTTLESCKTTLHLMLTTLDFAEKVASRRESVLEPELVNEDERLLVAALVTAQRDSIQRLEALEDQDEAWSEENGGAAIDTLRNEDSPRNPEDYSKRRDSIWLQSLLPLPLECTAGKADENHSSRQLPDLLSEWTDQGTVGLQSERDKKEGHNSEIASDLTSKDETAASISQLFKTNDETSQSNSLATAGISESWSSWRMSMHDTTHEILQAAVKKYNINADWRNYAMYIHYGNQERCLGLEEKPLRLFKQLDREGKAPGFVLKPHKTSKESATPTGEVGQLADYQTWL